MSPPGVPNGMIQRPGDWTRQGFGVRRGRLPGATHDGCPRTAHDCAPRDDTAMPVPGTTGVSQLVSDGVEHSPFPSLSTTQTIDVSGGGPTGSSLPAIAGTNGVWPGTSPGRGIPGEAFQGSIARQRSEAQDRPTSASTGTSTKSGSPR